MTILVTGSTGTIGSHVIEQLTGKGVKIRALARSAKAKNHPADVETVIGDMTDVNSMRAALVGVDTLFLLNAVVPDELTQALITLDLAVEAGIERIVYFSVYNGALFSDVPHFTAKYNVERAIEDRGIPATILRPAYFFQNDATLKQAIQDYGVYPMPLGSVGAAMVDARDIAEVAALELLRRERSSVPLPRTTIEIVGPEVITGELAAKVWSDTIGKTVSYAGDDLDAFEGMVSQFAPAVTARDMRMMFRGFQKFGMLPGQWSQSILTGVLGKPLRSYADFVAETVETWKR
ncbi:SDR family oxidoreductase [Pseudomonas viridiflava]|uniref:SDR family oxidoreductase n=1 Tax=Pseudomonas viridiflava TaxID=33069 RepID=UPI000C07190E|nr:NmrA family NAD(P)-binding protein [Pseudomonas viridiflava]PHN62709.1 NmrA family transcriptional regulator [Pseudomonas viridiflava]